VLLLKPATGVPTADAYRRFDVATASDAGDLKHENDAIEAICRAYAAADFSRMRDLLHNDLQAPVEASYPDVAHTRNRLVRAGAAATIMCGSGSCVAALFETTADADEARAHVPLSPGEWIAATGFADGV
jgi:4-diphosphocytidyl-2-C-methyl-D-erythritol kinase